MVEALWRVIKRKYLIDFRRPRLDLAIHLIIKNALPTIVTQLEQLRGDFRPGRAAVTASWQKAFRAEWIRLGLSDAEQEAIRAANQAATEAQNALNGIPTLEPDHTAGSITWYSSTQPQAWSPDLDEWVCGCYAYSLSRFMMCKHLVRLANTRLSNSPLTSLAFFAALRRNHEPPYYHVEGIHVVDSEPQRIARGSSIRETGLVLSTRTPSGVIKKSWQLCKMLIEKF